MDFLGIEIIRILAPHFVDENALALQSPATREINAGGIGRYPRTLDSTAEKSLRGSVRKEGLLCVDGLLTKRLHRVPRAWQQLANFFLCLTTGDACRLAGAQSEEKETNKQSPLSNREQVLAPLTLIISVFQDERWGSTGPAFAAANSRLAGWLERRRQFDPGAHSRV